MRLTLNADAMLDLDPVERSAWGIIHYLTFGGWQRYGVMPPPNLRGPVSSPLIASTLGITDLQARGVVNSLISKGAIHCD